MNRYVILFFLFSLSCFAADIDSITWPEIQSVHKPWTRWWWHGNAVKSSEIDRHLDEFQTAGIGGIEITSIYGVRGQDNYEIPYLSNDYIDILNNTAEQATNRGLGVDIPPGSGWRCGGLGLEKEFADARVVFQIDTLRAGESFERQFDQQPQALMAFSDDGSVRDLVEYIQKNKILWTPESGEWTVYTVSQRWSGANVKRPAPGGEGYSFNPYSRVSTDRMLQPFSAAFERLQHKNIRAIFHDSFEYSGDWMPNFFQEFQARRGYDLQSFLPYLMGHGDVETVRRVKCDYRETISDLVLHNFILPLQSWSHERGWLLRNQSHGSPANLLDLYGTVDIPETEIFRFDHDPRVLKFASSAAHVMGKPLVSSESFTWQAEHFTVTLDTMKRSADLLFTSGINHIFFHGTTYSPADAEWPGWLFYASSQINPQNPIWRDLPAFNSYITRCQSLLQNSQPNNDVLVYWPVYDVWSEPDGLNRQLAVHHAQWISENPAGRVAEHLTTAGYGYDFISDAQIQLTTVEQNDIKTPGATYKTIVVPHCEYMPLETFNHLIELGENGATIIFENDWPEKVPGFHEWQRRQKVLSEMVVSLRPDAEGICSIGSGKIVLSKNLAGAFTQVKDNAEVFSQYDNLKWIRNRHEDGFLYFISNQSTKNINDWIKLGTPFSSVAIFDPMNGTIGAAQKKENSVYLQLAAGQSLFLKTFKNDISIDSFPYWTRTEAPVKLDGEWTIEFVTGGPTLPQSFQQTELTSWTQADENAAKIFAGTARYSITFDAPDQKAGMYRLDLGEVAESAKILLNGTNVGTLFSQPFVVNVELNSTGNKLEIDVTNLAANRIRDLDRRGVEWRIFDDINFVNIDYQPFDASTWPIRDSGLLGPVTVTPISQMEF